MGLFLLSEADHYSAVIASDHLDYWHDYPPELISSRIYSSLWPVQLRTLHQTPIHGDVRFHLVYWPAGTVLRQPDLLFDQTLSPYLEVFQRSRPRCFPGIAENSSNKLELSSKDS